MGGSLPWLYCWVAEGGAVRGGRVVPLALLLDGRALLLDGKAGGAVQGGRVTPLALLLLCDGSGGVEELQPGPNNLRLERGSGSVHGHCDDPLDLLVGTHSPLSQLTMAWPPLASPVGGCSFGKLSKGAFCGSWTVGEALNGGVGAGLSVSFCGFGSVQHGLRVLVTRWLVISATCLPGCKES